ncbi:MAG: tetratricopeptide repeat protein [Anaerolineales bacterium]|nr:tetratricopeptide repeat protein [Anaerolineales bacterium]
MSLSPYVIDVNEATFEQDVLLKSHEVPVVVDFWALWCGPCKTLGPMLERFALEAGGSFVLAKLNVDENPSLAVRYGVQGIPAVKAFQNGQVAHEFVGAQPEGMLRRFLEQVVPDEADQTVNEARSLLMTHQWDQAEQSFREILSENDANPAAALGLLESLLMQGRGSEAQKLIADFPAGTEWAQAELYRPLAKLLTEVEDNGPGYDDQDPLAAELYQAGRLIARGNVPAAMDGLIDILRHDKRYRDGLPREILLALFGILGDEDTLTQQYREELASVLF